MRFLSFCFNSPRCHTGFQQLNQHTISLLCRNPFLGFTDNSPFFFRYRRRNRFACYLLHRTTLGRTGFVAGSAFNTDVLVNHMDLLFAPEMASTGHFL